MIVRPLAELLYDYRLSYPMGRTELARKAGCSHSYVSRIEDGSRVHVERSYIEAFADALQLPPDKRDRLLASAGYLPEDVTNLLFVPELGELQAVFHQCPPAVQADLRATLRTALRAARAMGG